MCSVTRLFDIFSRIISSEMHGVPCSWNGFADRCLESVESWFDDLGNFIWSFPVSSKLAGVQFLGVFEDYALRDVSQLEKSRPDFLIVVVLDLMLIILDAE